MKLQFRKIKFQKKTVLILEQVQKIIEQYDMPVTVRQIFYRLVAGGFIQNKQSEYNKVSRICTDGRYNGLLDWDKITDSTRGAIKTPDYENIKEAIELKLSNYRRSRWTESKYYIEVWCEKRTMTSQLEIITDEYDVFLNVGGGFNSAGAIWESIRRFYNHREKEIIVIYLGDLDPSGWFMSFDVEKRLNEFGNQIGFSVNVERILLNLEQVQKYKLPPVYEVIVKRGDKSWNKLIEDSRSKFFIENFGEVFQIEFEAMDPRETSKILKAKLDEYYDKDYAYKIIGIEQSELEQVRETLGYNTTI